jgi:hypothetical protein
MAIDESKECVVELPTGCELRTPAHPEPCEYVRIVDPMAGEVAYWDCAEWQEDPQGVMGAIVGAMVDLDNPPEVARKAPEPPEEWRTVTHTERVRVCPDCGASMRRPTDPDSRVTFGWRCPDCRKVL